VSEATFAGRLLISTFVPWSSVIVSGNVAAGLAVGVAEGVAVGVAEGLALAVAVGVAAALAITAVEAFAAEEVDADGDVAPPHAMTTRATAVIRSASRGRAERVL
jgi:hypothetical protein